MLSVQSKIGSQRNVWLRLGACTLLCVSLLGGCGELSPPAPVGAYQPQGASANYGHNPGYGSGYLDPSSGQGYGSGYGATRPASSSFEPGNAPHRDPNIYDFRQNFFQHYGVNPFIEAELDPLSTFSVDVDTASYALARKYLETGVTPDPAAIRPEEFLNAFDYRYRAPVDDDFALHMETVPSPFGEGYYLRVGVQARELSAEETHPVHLTFAIDVSGSMSQGNRLELVKQSLSRLIDQLQARDRVAIIMYSTEARQILPPTSAQDKATILAELERLRPAGGTDVEVGLKEAFQTAQRMYQPEAYNRVILCSDGVANRGRRSADAILAQVRPAGREQIPLSTLGFGMQGYNDVLLEQLANRGDGNYGYIDTLQEAQRLLVDQFSSNMHLLARDVKLQLKFDPQYIESYRLLGYENRDIADRDFRNDAVDAGEVGAGHSVTALYELRFKPEAQELSRSQDFATLSLRYTRPKGGAQELTQGVRSSSSFATATQSTQLAVAVAELAEHMRDSVFVKNHDVAQLKQWVRKLNASQPQNTQLQELEQMVGYLQPGPNDFSLEATVQEAPVPQEEGWMDYLLRQLGGKALQ